MTQLRLATAAVLLALLTAACGGLSTTTPTPTAAVAPSPTPTPSAAPTATPTPASVTFQQSIAVAKALFPKQNGMYEECDSN
ncbi:MAG: hypothetical protein ABR498_07570, partial [Candidatus Dormibacteria bacterium]